MDRARVVMTEERDIHSFQAGIFAFGADILVPVGIVARSHRFQPLQDFFAEMERHPEVWSAYAGPAGVGQYSLTHGPAGVLSRVNVYFRNPTQEEAAVDYMHFGEQVMGSKLSELGAGRVARASFRSMGDWWEYAGPERIEKSVFVTRVFSGAMPSDVSDIVREVDAKSGTGDMIVPQGYQFMHATDGRILYGAFARAEDFYPDKLTVFGSVEIKGREMTYFPGEDRSHPIDFSLALID